MVGICLAIACQLSASNPAWSQVTAEQLQQRWEATIRPIFSAHCLQCHNDLKHSGKLSLESISNLLKGSLSGNVIQNDRSDESLLLQVLQPNAESHMPPEGQLSNQEIETIRQFLSDFSAIKPPAIWSIPAEATTTDRSNALKLTISPDLSPAAAINLAISTRWTTAAVATPLPVNDLQFARRLYLDLLGRIPTVEELNRFVNRNESTKRELLVDELLGSAEHANHLAEILNALFLGRQEAGAIRNADKAGWFEYLRTSIREDRSWNDVAREILLARPTHPQQAGAVWYLYSRKNNHQEIAEAVSRDFFGVRIDCAQCHDHPLANEILQRHYWGLAAFFNRSSNTDSSKGLRIAESAIGGFSEFANIRGSSAPNALVFIGTETIPEDRPAATTKEEDRDDLYFPGQDGEPRIPKFSRREQFVEHVLKDHPLVAQAMVNRLWGLLLGRGLIHPVDAMDSFHPASHPELLDWLSRDFERSGYKIRRLLKQIALSDVYQLSYSKSSAADPTWFASSFAKPLTAEMLLRSIQTALATKDPARFNSLENRVAFGKLFPDVLAEESLSHVSQGLMLTNSELIDQLIATESSTLLEELTKLDQPQEITNRLFLSILQRSPDEEEEAKFLQLLSNPTRSKTKIIEDLAWALITSAEFRFNH
jgi:hypothetical protein